MKDAPLTSASGNSPLQPSTRAPIHHEFFTNKPMLVCGNTAAMVGETRLAPHFNVQGDHNLHHGLFPCGPQDGAAPAPKGEDTPGGCC